MLAKKVFAIESTVEPISFSTDPSRYKHWKLEVEGDVARLILNIPESGGIRPGYVLKLNSYDLGVDIELADAVNRIRFEHPEVRSVVITSGKDRVFSSGANIGSLATSTHSFKVNFCKATNETRLDMEEASARSGIRFLAALNGATAGGGYELAMACDQILLVDDGSSAVSLPEVGLLGVLPGTGGITRLTDKRHVRPDRADRFSTMKDQGVKGKRAVEWGLVDATVPRSKWNDAVKTRAAELADRTFEGPKRVGPGIKLDAIEPIVSPGALTYKYVTVNFDHEKRTAELIVRAPDTPQPTTLEEFLERGSDSWALRAFRELDDAMLRLRFNHEEIGVVLLKTEGDLQAIQAVDKALADHRDNWLVNEIIQNMSRALRRLDMTSKTFFAVMEAGSCFAGPLLELALAADQVFALNDPGVKVWVGQMNDGTLPTWNGISRLTRRFYGSPEKTSIIVQASEPLDAQTASDLGLVTVLEDELNFGDQLRVDVEARVAISPDALTGMEMNFRLVGPETLASRIFGLLSAWQNWLFRGKNATGPDGALPLYGKGRRPQFDWKRT